MPEMQPSFIVVGDGQKLRLPNCFRLADNPPTIKDSPPITWMQFLQDELGTWIAKHARVAKQLPVGDDPILDETC
jgi:hypothetical protein